MMLSWSWQYSGAFTAVLVKGARAPRELLRHGNVVAATGSLSQNGGALQFAVGDYSFELPFEQLELLLVGGEAVWERPSRGSSWRKQLREVERAAKQQGDAMTLAWVRSHLRALFSR